MNLSGRVSKLEGVRRYASIGEVLDLLDWADSDWPVGLEPHPDLITELDRMAQDDIN